MKRRKWDAKTKATIVLQGLKWRSVAELCSEYQINQAQYYHWRDQFLAHAGQAFEVLLAMPTGDATPARKC